MKLDRKIQYWICTNRKELLDYLNLKSVEECNILSILTWKGILIEGREKKFINNYHHRPNHKYISDGWVVINENQRKFEFTNKGIREIKQIMLNSEYKEND